MSLCLWSVKRAYDMLTRLNTVALTQLNWMMFRNSWERSNSFQIILFVSFKFADLVSRYKVV